MRIVIVGATGNLGTSTLHSLISDARVDSILGVARRRPQLQLPKVEWAEADIRSADLGEIFQRADSPKGSVNVNVENGVVYLRGEVKQPDQIRKLVEQAGAVDGVSAVENLLST